MHINFYAVDEDMKHLMRLCEEQKLVVVPLSYKIGEEDLKGVSPLEYELTDQQFGLMPREMSIEEDLVYIEGSKNKRGIAVLEKDDSPVIVCAPPIVWGTKLDGGFLDVGGEASGYKFTLVERRYDFLQRTMRKWARTDKNQGWVAPAAEKLVKEKRLQLGLGKRSVTLW